MTPQNTYAVNRNPQSPIYFPGQNNQMMKWKYVQTKHVLIEHNI